MSFSWIRISRKFVASGGAAVHHVLERVDIVSQRCVLAWKLDVGALHGRGAILPAKENAGARPAFSRTSPLPGRGEDPDQNL